MNYIQRMDGIDNGNGKKPGILRSVAIKGDSPTKQQRQEENKKIRKANERMLCDLHNVISSKKMGPLDIILLSTSRCHINASIAH